MFIGIDTSCYTTSIAVVDHHGTVIHDYRRVLCVERGNRGLRQSEAVFQHLQNLPQLLDERFPGIQVTAVTASVIPRPIPGSYLPVFKAGASFGETLAKLLGVPFLPTSHQEGHIRAGLFQQMDRFNQRFLTWHISGGTTELLLVQPEKNGYNIEKIGGSSDLQVGQFVDRVGVALGEAFPAGPAVEKRALQSDSRESLPVVTQGLFISFSGPDSAAQRLIAAGTDGNEIARKVLNCISKSLLKVSIQAAREFKIPQILMVGGVASNQIVREYMKDEGYKKGIEFSFALKELSSDNAVGVSLIGFDHFN